MNDVANKLREARALVAKGWTQGEWRDGASRCALSALHAVRAPVAADNALRAVVGGGITDWNDAKERTQAEVLAAFDKAIELAEAGQ